MAELAEGSVFAGHRIEGMAGRGGMGVVYRARHLALDRVVALKVIAPNLAGDELYRRRFTREMRIAVSIRHPNVVPIHHAGEEQGILFVTMEFVPGFDLRALIKGTEGLAPQRTAALIRQVAAALDAAHECGLIHRDVKPGNVLIDGRRSDEHVYLTDFGLTKYANGVTAEITPSGRFIGTLDYMAPEQIRGEDVDWRSDVYSLGAMLFGALTGRPPFAYVDGDVPKMYAHLNDTPPILSELRSDLPPRLDDVAAKALAKSPDDRFQTAIELAMAVDDAVADGPLGGFVSRTEPDHASLDRPARAEPDSESSTVPRQRTSGKRSAPFRRGRPRIYALLALLLAVAAAVAVVVISDGDVPRDDPGSSLSSDQVEPEPRPPVSGALAGPPVEVGPFPVGVSFDRVRDQVLVGDRGAGTVTSVDEGKAEVTSTVATGAAIEASAVGFGSAWAVDSRQDLVQRLDPQTLAPVSDPIGTGALPRDVLVADAAVWVANRESDSLTRIDPATNTTSTVAADPYPRALVLERSRMWVASRDAGTVQALDPGDGTPLDPPVELGGEPHGMAVSDKSLWVANTTEDILQRVHTKAPASRVSETPTCDEPRDVAVGFGSLWVACGAGRELRQLDLSSRSVIEKFRFETELETLVIGEDRVWVAGGEGGGLSAIDPSP